MVFSGAVRGRAVQPARQGGGGRPQLPAEPARYVVSGVYHAVYVGPWHIDRGLLRDAGDGGAARRVRQVYQGQARIGGIAAAGPAGIFPVSAVCRTACAGALGVGVPSAGGCVSSRLSGLRDPVHHVRHPVCGQWND